MRTTIDVPDQLLAEAKRLAAERRLPLTRLFEDVPAPLPLLRDPVPVEGIDLADTSRLWEID